jgi:hypothetical protein
MCLGTVSRWKSTSRYETQHRDVHSHSFTAQSLIPMYATAANSSRPNTRPAPIHTQTIPSLSKCTHLKSHPPHRTPLALIIECLTRHHHTPRIATLFHPPSQAHVSILFQHICISTATRIHSMPVARPASPACGSYPLPVRPSHLISRPHPHAHTNAIRGTCKTTATYIRIDRHWHWGRTDALAVLTRSCDLLENQDAT